MSLNHVSLATGPAHFDDMKKFYDAILAPIGYKKYMAGEGFYGLQNAARMPDFWLHCGGVDLDTIDAHSVDKPRSRTHIAFSASSPKRVDEWYRNAIKSGGIPNGEPGERKYAKGYYAAFVLDPLGNNVEVVCFNPWWIQVLKAAPTVLTALVGASGAYLAMTVMSRG